MRCILQSKRKRQWYKKYSEKATSPNKQKEKRKKRVWLYRGAFICMYVCMYQPGKVANSARGQLNRENITFPCSRSRLRIWSRETGSAVPRQPAHLHTQAESGAYLRDSSPRVPWRRPFIYFKPPYAIGSVPSLSGHAFAYRWRSLPRVRRHRARKPQGSSERVLPWQVTMDQLICASLSHTHYWYEVGMLKVYRRTIERRAAASTNNA